MNSKQRTTLVVVGVVALAAWARCDDRPTPFHSAPAVTATASPTATATSSMQPSTPEPAQTTPPSKVTELDSLARQAITAWQAPTVEQRQAFLQPIATPNYLQLASTIDPAEVPTAVVDDVTPYPAPDASVIDVTLHDGTRLTIDVLTIDGRDLIDNIRPADA